MTEQRYSLSSDETIELRRLYDEGQAMEYSIDQIIQKAISIAEVRHKIIQSQTVEMWTKAANRLGLKVEDFSQGKLLVNVDLQAGEVVVSHPKPDELFIAETQ